MSVVTIPYSFQKIQIKSKINVKSNKIKDIKRLFLHRKSLPRTMFEKGKFSTKSYVI